MHITKLLSRNALLTKTPIRSQVPTVNFTSSLARLLFLPFKTFDSFGKTYHQKKKLFHISLPTFISSFEKPQSLFFLMQAQLSLVSFLQTLFPHSNLQPVSLPSDSHFTFILKSLVMLTITFQVCFCIYIPVFYIFYFGTRLSKCQSWCSRYMLPVFSKMVFLSRLCLCFRLFGTLPHLLSCIEIGHEW